MKLSEERLVRANSLKEGLAEEEIRWKDLLIKYKKDVEFIIANSILVSQYMTFCSPYTKFYRDFQR